MDRTKITKDYMDSYNEIVMKYKENKIPELVEAINNAISKSDKKNINIVHEKISEWNNSISNLENQREALISHNSSFKLPSIKGYLIVFDQIIREWRFNTEA